MRIFSYRNKRRLMLIGLIVLALVLVLAVASVAYVIYLGRFMVYTSDGAYLALPGQEAAEPPDEPDAQTPTGGYLVGEKVERPASTLPVPDEPEPDEDVPLALTAGFYITTADLRSVDQTRTHLEDILAAREDDGAMTILVDLKSEFGNFYYASSVSDAPTASSADLAAIRSLLQTLSARRDVHLIARLPAFRDSSYALAHTGRSLALSSGALWADGDGCYWLDPGSEAVLDRLLALCTELAGLGVDEVMFSSFRFPDDERIVYAADPAEVLEAAAERLASGSPIPVSLSYDEGETDCPGAAFASHVCLSADDGGDIAGALEPLPAEFADEPTRIIFLSASRDTRFDAFLQLRPITEE